MSEENKVRFSNNVKINTCTIGHVDHGKTTLTSVLTKLAGQYKAYDQIDSGKEEKVRGITINVAHVWYQTSKRIYTHVDCPGHVDYIKNMIVGSSQVDIAILVVSVNDGVMPQTREHLRLIKSIGVKSIVVFFNKVDMIKAEDEILLEVAIEDTLNLINNEYGYDDVSYVKGSALAALEGSEESYGLPAIRKLLELLDNSPVKERDHEKPFLMQSENIVSITGRGTVVTGRVIRGIAKINDEVEIIGNRIQPIKAVITSIEMFNTTVDKAEPGDNTAVLLRGIGKKDINRGSVLAKPGSIQAYDTFTAVIMVNLESEGGRKKGFTKKYKPQFYLLAADVTGEFIEFLDDNEIICPGETANVKIRLQIPQAIEVNTSFIIREGGITVAIGKVTSLGNPIVK